MVVTERPHFAAERAGWVLVEGQRGKGSGSHGSRLIRSSDSIRMPAVYSISTGAVVQGSYKACYTPNRAEDGPVFVGTACG